MELIRQKELLKRLNIKSKATIYRWRKDGLPFIKQKASIFYDYEDVVNWLKNKDETNNIEDKKNMPRVRKDIDG